MVSPLISRKCNYGDAIGRKIGREAAILVRLGGLNIREQSGDITDVGSDEFDMV